MRVLAAITACHKYTPFAAAWRDTGKESDVRNQINACRLTWVKDLAKYGIDYKFFYGGTGNRKPLDDEVFLNVPDDYRGLPCKTQGIQAWSYISGYDFTFKCDDDTFVWADRLANCGFEDYDYMGCSYNKDVIKHASGLGYWTSAKASCIIAESRVNDVAEDRWVGKTLYNAGIMLKNDPRYCHNSACKSFTMDSLPFRNCVAINPCDVDTMFRLGGVESPHFSEFDKLMDKVRIL